MVLFIGPIKTVAPCMLFWNTLSPAFYTQLFTYIYIYVLKQPSHSDSHQGSPPGNHGNHSFTAVDVSFPEFEGNSRVSSLKTLCAVIEDVYMMSVFLKLSHSHLDGAIQSVCHSRGCCLHFHKARCTLKSVFICFSVFPSQKTFLGSYFLKTKRRRSDPVLWQKPLYQQKYFWSIDRRAFICGIHGLSSCTKCTWFDL